MTATNELKKCAIKIAHTADDIGELENVASIKIKRKKTSELVWQTIGTIIITGEDDLDFSVLDFYAQKGVSYDYATIPVISNVEQAGHTATVVHDYQGMMIGNLNKQYVCGLDVEFDRQRHYAMNYVQTYYSKYPASVRNGNMNYYTGNAGGLFLPQDAAGEFITTGALEYVEGLLDFLSNGDAKVLKTHRGLIMEVQIDEAIAEESSEFENANVVKFSWTEIGAVPTEGVVACD